MKHPHSGILHTANATTFRAVRFFCCQEYAALMWKLSMQSEPHFSSRYFSHSTSRGSTRCMERSHNPWEARAQSRRERGVDLKWWEAPTKNLALEIILWVALRRTTILTLSVTIHSHDFLQFSWNSSVLNCYSVHAFKNSFVNSCQGVSGKSHHHGLH